MCTYIIIPIEKKFIYKKIYRILEKPGNNKSLQQDNNIVIP